MCVLKKFILGETALTSNDNLSTIASQFINKILLGKINGLPILITNLLNPDGLR